MFVARRLAAGHRGSLLPQRTRGIEEFLTEHGAVAVMESRIVPVPALRDRELQRRPDAPALPRPRAGHRGRHGPEGRSPTSPSAAAFPISARPRRSSRSPCWCSSPCSGRVVVRASHRPRPRLISHACHTSRPSGSTRSSRSASSARWIVTAIGGFSESGASASLGWTHGFGWILLCLLVATAAGASIFPWPLLAATVSPLGPIGARGIEIARRVSAGADAGAACSRSTSRTRSR